MTTIHGARVVMPVSSVPIAGGAVVEADGVIVGVGRFDDMVRAHPAATVIEWPGVMIPGLVNAHTHLQYSTFAGVGAVRHRSYVGWSERFVSEYETRQNEDWRQASVAGVQASLRAGVTCFADIVTDDSALDVLSEQRVAGVSYIEVIGVPLERWRDETEERVRRLLDDRHVTGDASIGLSPHAPYSVDEPVLAEMIALARNRGVRLHTHLAESDTEDDYYRTGTGALAERVTMRVGRPWSVVARGGSGMGAGEYARVCGVLGPGTHLAHGVYLGAEGRRIVSEAGTYVALCPRSNVNVGVDPPPVAAFLAEGRLMAVGTDSLGSNASLDLMEEVAFLRELAVEGGYVSGDLDRRLLRAATLGGAEAMGMGGRCGSLEVGKRADLAVFDLDGRGGERDVVVSGAGRCIGTVVAGAIRWRSPETRPAGS